MNTKEFMPLNCGVGEDSWNSFGQSILREILREISPAYSLEGLMLKLKLQYFGHWIWPNQLTEKVPDAGKYSGQKEKRVSEGIRGWDDWMTSPTQWSWTWADFGRWWEKVRPAMLQSMGSQGIGHHWMTWSIGSGQNFGGGWGVLCLP